ncbi:MAG: hypothetical protein C0505_01745 [Leptothrix sp. (in: Bacteria)]|nr:hypothetical protein [Leptothrix sp. (in: b-proteobacteria)]
MANRDLPLWRGGAYRTSPQPALLRRREGGATRHRPAAAAPQGARPVPEELRRLGVQPAIDTFGTGCSSLSHLSSPPTDCPKIDRGFVSRLETGTSEAVVVRSILLPGTLPGKRAVAEGIEADGRQALLRQTGCQLGQGFRLARPLPPLDVCSLPDSPPQSASGSTPPRSANLPAAVGGPLQGSLPR